MNRKFVALAVLGSIAMQAVARAETLVIDDFEKYPAEKEIAISATSMPWLRFGLVDDNLIITSEPTDIMEGHQSAKIPVVIDTANGSASIARRFASATDLSKYATASVMVKSLSAKPSTAALQLYISNGDTTFVSTVSTPITTTAQTLTFPMDEAHLVLSSGPDSREKVLKTIRSFGFRISNAQGVTSTKETIDFDAVKVMTP